MPDYQRYLERYASHFDLSPTREELVRVAPMSGGFDIEARSGATLHCRVVVIATGMFSHPVRPDIGD